MNSFRLNRTSNYPRRRKSGSERDEAVERAADLDALSCRRAGAG